MKKSTPREKFLRLLNEYTSLEFYHYDRRRRHVACGTEVNKTDIDEIEREQKKLAGLVHAMLEMVEERYERKFTITPGEIRDITSKTRVLPVPVFSDDALERTHRALDKH